jgi:F420-non-reducing hydrogenase small subunit
MARPKVVFYWCASCGGCEESVVDLGEALLELAEQVEICLWPVALDHKYADLETIADGDVAVAFINGAIRTGEQERIARLLRRKAQLVVAFGACAMSGGVPALANLTSRRAIFTRSYLDSPTVVNPDGVTPRPRAQVDGHPVELPAFHETVHKLADVIEVDYSVPGCAPPAALLAEALAAILEDRLPPRGAVLAPDHSLCRSCSRNESKPEDVGLHELRRVVDTAVDPELCFLAQGIICMGPATRDGCGEPCILGNMPCTGCFGPTGGCHDQGAKMIATLGGILRGDDEAAIERTLAGMPDLAGTLYRYGLSASLLGAAREEPTP